MARQKSNYAQVQAAQQPQPAVPTKDSVAKTTAANVTIKNSNN
jgi:hypothetical protein